MAAKGGDVYSAVSGIVDNARIIASPTASIGEKIAAGFDIALDVGTGINTKDIQTAARAVEGAGDKLGGAYNAVKNANKNRGGETHHMPSRASTGDTGSKGPSIWMEKDDHKMTASHPSQSGSKEFRESQRELFDSGKAGQRKAMANEIRDVRSKFGNHYDVNIKQMLNDAKKQGMLEK